MLSKKMRSELFAITEVENEQLENGGLNIQDVAIEESLDSTIAGMPYWNFFDYGKIAVTKSNRFSYVPAHTHQFIELNYVLSGQSVQYLNDQKIVLHSGCLLMMDRDVQQRINYASGEDILINILIRDDSEISRLLADNQVNTNLFGRLLFNAGQPNFNHANYLVADLSDNMLCQHLVESIIIAGWKNKGENNQILELLVRALLLAPISSFITKNVNFNNVRQDEMMHIIKYLNQNFQNITLEKLAQEFGYNPNYLGEKIKHETGHSFKQILQMRRLNIASNLIMKTNLTIHEISEFVGYENHSSLFRLFESILHVTPTEYRQRVRHPQQLDQDQRYYQKYTKE